MESHVQPEKGVDTSLIIKAKDIGTEMAKLLQCPVCYEIITPPIVLCGSGHAICSHCKKRMNSCPTCRSPFTDIRCRFAEDFLDQCLVKCRYRDAGCQASLPGRELSLHHKICDFRPLVCLKCDKEVEYNSFLDHLRNVENVNFKTVAEHSSTMNLKTYFDSQRVSWLWGPFWIRAYDRDFFYFLKTSKPNWWLWVSIFGATEECQNYKCSITISNKEMETELTYIGKIQPFRTLSIKARESGHRLLFTDSDVKNLMHNDKIYVVVRVEKKHADTPGPVPVSASRKRKSMRLTVNGTTLKPHRF